MKEALNIKKIIYSLYPKESWRNNLCRSQDQNRCELDLSLLLFHFHCYSSVFSVQCSVGRSGFLEWLLLLWRGNEKIINYVNLGGPFECPNVKRRQHPCFVNGIYF